MINQGIILYQSIKQILHIKSIENRAVVAQVYEQALNTKLPIPKPYGLMGHVPRRLRSKVCGTCPSKPSPHHMQQILDQAVLVLSQYKKDIHKWLKDQGIDPDGKAPSTSVHDLGPTI